LVLVLVNPDKVKAGKPTGANIRTMKRVESFLFNRKNNV
jgi:hypothetical protein